jgi:Carbohydrate binding module (family 6)
MAVCGFRGLHRKARSAQLASLSGAITVNSTGGWQVWTTVTAKVTLSAGNHVLRVYMDSANGSFNINTISIN